MIDRNLFYKPRLRERVWTAVQWLFCAALFAGIGVLLAWRG